MGEPAYEHIDRYVRKVVDILGRQTSMDDSLEDTEHEWRVLIDRMDALMGNDMGICLYLRISMFWEIDAPLVPNPSPDASAWRRAISKIYADLKHYDMMQGRYDTVAGVVNSINVAILVLCEVEAEAGKSAIKYKSYTIPH